MRLSSSPDTLAQSRPVPLLTLYPLFFVAVYLGHLTLLRLPYFWDEGGYYIPSAIDFFRTGTLIPHSTVTNAHPPLPAILLAGVWHLTGFVVSGTRTFICMVSAAALLAVYRMARTFLGQSAACAVAMLTALYPIWYVQSTLAHADIFAAAFTLWALALYLDPLGNSRRGDDPNGPSSARLAAVAVLFAFAALSKETAIVTPLALAVHRLWSLASQRQSRHTNLLWLASLSFCLVPLVAWYAYHYHQTGFIFGNPEFLRYNATANMDAHRIALSLYHRLLHLFAHMNMWVATVLTVACFLLPRRGGVAGLPKHLLIVLLLIVVINWIAFSVLGGALLTRYLLPVYPLLLLVFVAVWRQRTRLWPLLAAFATASFLVALHVNPPYAFAPEDNLTYRDMIQLHQQAIALISCRFPKAIVLTAWPANAELIHPELGYTQTPIAVATVQNFAIDQLDGAGQHAGDYDTALLFSTKYEPPAGRADVSKSMRNSDAKYFDFHRDLLPQQAASLLHGEVIWQEQRNGEWAAVLRFPRSFVASEAFRQVPLFSAPSL